MIKQVILNMYKLMVRFVEGCSVFLRHLLLGVCIRRSATLFYVLSFLLLLFLFDFFFFVTFIHIVKNFLNILISQIKGHSSNIWCIKKKAKLLFCWPQAHNWMPAKIYLYWSFKTVDYLCLFFSSVWSDTFKHTAHA